MTSPNIVLILVDDADAKVLEHVASSRIRDALLHDGPTRVGTTATRYLTTHPLCAPSRASMLTGKYPQNTGVTGNSNAYENFVDHGGEQTNIARWLKSASTPYQTAMIGKYMNHYEPDVDGRSNAGFDYWFGVGSGGYNGYDYYAWDDYKSGANKIRHYGDDSDPTNYLTDVLKRKALQFLDNQSSTVPFFMMITPMAPHYPAVPAAKYTDKYLNETYPQTPSFDEADVSDKPWYVSNQDRVSQDTVDRINTFFHHRLECMESVADLVEEVITKLRNKNWLANTYVFFTSDHGFHMGEHRLASLTPQDEADGSAPGGKNSMYEEDIRVPLWIRHPGIAGPTVDKLLGNVDLAPTFAEIAGVDPNTLVSGPDGRSFLPLLNGQSVSWRTQYLISRGQNKPFVGFRHENEWVFEQLLTPALNEIEGEYYYGLDNTISGDPYQLSNGYLSLDPSRLEELQELAENYGACSGGSCRIYDSQNI